MSEQDVTRDPREVMKLALENEVWATWHPGDGTQYRVKILRIVGGPAHTDRILLIALTHETRCIQYVDPSVAAYRSRKITRADWKANNSNTDYDWWPQVVQPLLAAVGVA